MSADNWNYIPGCENCGLEAVIWSQKKGQEKRFWCSHTCKLKKEENE